MKSNYFGPPIAYVNIEVQAMINVGSLVAAAVKQIQAREPTPPAVHNRDLINAVGGNIGAVTPINFKLFKNSSYETTK